MLIQLGLPGLAGARRGVARGRGQSRRDALPAAPAGGHPVPPLHFARHRRPPGDDRRGVPGLRRPDPVGRAHPEGGPGRGTGHSGATRGGRPGGAAGLHLPARRFEMVEVAGIARAADPNAIIWDAVDPGRLVFVGPEAFDVWTGTFSADPDGRPLAARGAGLPAPHRHPDLHPAPRPGGGDPRGGRRPAGGGAATSPGRWPAPRASAPSRSCPALIEEFGVRSVVFGAPILAMLALVVAGALYFLIYMAALALERESSETGPAAHARRLHLADHRHPHHPVGGDRLRRLAGGALRGARHGGAERADPADVHPHRRRGAVGVPGPLRAALRAGRRPADLHRHGPGHRPAGPARGARIAGAGLPAGPAVGVAALLPGRLPGRAGGGGPLRVAPAGPGRHLPAKRTPASIPSRWPPRPCSCSPAPCSCCGCCPCSCAASAG